MEIRDEIMIVTSLWIDNHFPESWTREVFNNTVKITIEEIVGELILYGCYCAYYKSAEKHSLRDHLKKNGMYDDSERMRYQRILARINKDKFKHYHFYEDNYGVSVKSLLPKNMNDIENKLEGYEFNDFEFREIMDVGESKFQEWIYQERLGKKNLKNETFRYESKIHDEKILQLQKKTEDPDEFEALFAFFTLYIIEIQYDIEFIYKIVQELERKDKKSDIDLFDRTSIFRTSIPGLLIPSLGYSEEVTSIKPSYSRLIIIREKFINSIIECTSFEAFKQIQNQYLMTVGLILDLLKYMPFHGKPLYIWFIESTDVSDWLHLYRNSNLVNLFNANKEWSNKKIREFRNLFPVNAKNPRKRS